MESMLRSRHRLLLLALAVLLLVIGGAVFLVNRG